MSVVITSDDSNECDLPLVKVPSIDNTVLSSIGVQNSSPKSDATINYDIDNPDDVFDAIVHTNVTKLKNANTGLKLSSTSSGYCSGGSKRVAGDDNESSDTDNEAPTETLTKKQKLAKEKAAKQLNNEMNKVYKPGECMKYMNINIQTELLESWFMGDLKREVESTGAKIVLSEDYFKNIVSFSRRKHQVFSSNGSQVKLTDPIERCDHCLLIYEPDEIASYVIGNKLSDHLNAVREMVDTKLTLVVFGLKDYYKKKKQQNQKKFSELDLEMAFTDVLVSTECDSITVDTPNQLALLVVHFTKALAEKPHKLAKRACDEEADFYMRGDNKKCVMVDKDGHGLSRLWQQMLSVLPHSSLETARAITAQHKSPLDLYEALTQSDDVSAISDIEVGRTGVVNSKGRRIGPEFAKKLKKLFTSSCGDELID